MFGARKLLEKLIPICWDLLKPNPKGSSSEEHTAPGTLTLGKGRRRDRLQDAGPEGVWPAGSLSASPWFTPVRLLNNPILPVICRPGANSVSS